MKINRNNYEVYFLDFLEGSLSKELCVELEQFLILNPDLKEELDNYESVELEPTIESYQYKNSLKKNTNNDLGISRFEEKCIAYFENELTETDELELKNKIQNDLQLHATFNLYKKTYLQPNQSITYDYKSKLKRYKISIRKRIYRISIAAASAILVIIGSYYILNNSSNSQQLANSEVIPSTTKPAKDIISQNITSNIAERHIEKKISETPKKQSFINSVQDDSEKDLIIANNLSDETPTQLNAKSYQFNIPEPIYRINYSNSVKKTSPGSQPKELTIEEYAVNRIKNDILKLSNDKNNKLTMWDLMEAGINGLNSTERIDIKITREDDGAGKIKILAFNSKLFGMEFN